MTRETPEAIEAWALGSGKGGTSPPCGLLVGLGSVHLGCDGTLVLPHVSLRGGGWLVGVGTEGTVLLLSQ